MGYLERNRPLVDVKGLRNVTGGTLPAAMWNEYMRRALAGTSPTPFADAPGTWLPAKACVPVAGPEGSPLPATCGTAEEAPGAEAPPDPVAGVNSTSEAPREPAAEGDEPAPGSGSPGRTRSPPPRLVPEPEPSPPVPGLGNLIGGVIGR